MLIYVSSHFYIIHMQLSCGLINIIRLNLHNYFGYGNSEGSGKDLCCWHMQLVPIPLSMQAS